MKGVFLTSVISVPDEEGGAFDRRTIVGGVKDSDYVDPSAGRVTLCPGTGRVAMALSKQSV